MGASAGIAILVCLYSVGTLNRHQDQLFTVLEQFMYLKASSFNDHFFTQKRKDLCA